MPTEQSSTTPAPKTSTDDSISEQVSSFLMAHWHN